MLDKGSYESDALAIYRSCEFHRRELQNSGGDISSGLLTIAGK